MAERIRKIGIACCSIVVILGISLGLGEIGSRFLYQHLYSEKYQKEKLEKSHDLIINADHLKRKKEGYPEYTGVVVPHPYFGYSYLPDSEELINGPTKENFNINKCRVNSEGLISVGSDPFLEKDGISILVLGGSVASQLLCHRGLEIISKLSASEKYKGKRINILGAAIGAWREPQQLQAYTYLISRGYRPSTVVAINGFNEAANPYAEVYKQINVLWPLYWAGMHSSENKETTESISAIKKYREMELFLANISEGLYDSALVGLIYKVMIENINTRISKEVDSIGNSGKYNFSQDGPVNNYSKDIGDVSVDAWFQSVVLESKISRSIGANFIEILQPTVLTGKKQFTENENRLKGFSYHGAIGVPRNYPKMIKLLKDERHINFFDSTSIFDNDAKEVFVDQCHLTDYGYEKLGDFVSNAIINSR